MQANSSSRILFSWAHPSGQRQKHAAQSSSIQILILSGPHKDDVANAQLREWNRLSFCALYAFRGVRKKGGERFERHAWLVVGKFAPCPVNEDDCPKDGWNKL